MLVFLREARNNPHFRKSLGEAILAPIVLLVIFAIQMWVLLLGDKSFATFQDNTYLILPIFSYISNSFLNGEFPYWMNTIMGGIPLYNAPQFSSTYPFYFFHSGLYSSPINALRQVHYLTLYHLFLLYLNSYVLMRILRLPIIASILAASILAFSPNMRSYATWVNIVAPYSWFPLAIAGVILILDHKYPKTGILLGAAALALLILASPSQPLIHVLYSILICYISYSLWNLREKKWATVGKTTMHLLIMGIISLLISSPSVIPALLDMKGMIRWIGPFPPMIGNEKIPFDAFLVGQSDLKDLYNVFFPTKTHFLIGNSYIGLLGMFLALFAILKKNNLKIILPLFFISLYALASSTGSQLGLAYINYYLPFFNKIREPGRHLFLFTFGSSVLAGFGFAYFSDVADRSYKTILNWKHILLAGVIIGVVFFAYVINRQNELLIDKRILFATVICCLGIFLFLPILEGWKKHVFMAFILGLTIYINLLQFPWNAPDIQHGDYFEKDNIISHRVLREISTTNNIKNYRIIFEDFNRQHWAMNASYYGLRSFNAYFNPLPYKQFDEIYYHRHQFDNYYELLGAKYLICETCNSETLKDYRFDRNILDYKVYTSDRALPRYYLVNELADDFVSPADFYEKINLDYTFWRKVYVERGNAPEISAWLRGQPPGLSCAVNPEKESVNNLIVSTACSGKSIFILNEYFTKNWKAMVNGVSAKTFKVNLNQVGILLDKGKNKIEFNYRPMLFISLLWVQRITVVIILCYLMFLCFLFARKLKTKMSRQNHHA